MRVRITNLKAINQVLGFLNKDLLQIKPIRRIIIILLMIYKQRMNRTSDYHGYLIVEYGNVNGTIVIALRRAIGQL